MTQALGAKPDRDPLPLRLKFARLRAGISQTDLAIATGLTNSSISKWESGTWRPTATSLSRLLSGLGFTREEIAEWLLDLAEMPPEPEADAEAVPA